MHKRKNNNTVTILVLAYGSPERVEDVKAFFSHIRGGVRPPAELIQQVAARYRAVGGATPLSSITYQQAQKLQELLDKDAGSGRYQVYVGMKHWHPYIHTAVEQILRDGSDKIIAVVLAPHFSALSIGGYKKYLNEALKTAHNKPHVVFIDSWHTNRYLLACIVKQIQGAFKKFGNVAADDVYHLFTAHSLPEKIRNWHDPYEEQLWETCQLVAQKLNISNWRFAFQSAGHTHEPWLGPDVLDVMLEIRKRGFINILVTSIGFVADNLEVLYDLDVECGQVARKNAINFQRTPSRNTHPLFIRALYDVVTAA